MKDTREYWSEVDEKGRVRAHVAAKTGTLPSDFKFWDIANKSGTPVAVVLAKKGIVAGLDSATLELKDKGGDSVLTYLLRLNALPESDDYARLIDGIPVALHMIMCYPYPLNDLLSSNYNEWWDKIDGQPCVADALLSNRSDTHPLLDGSNLVKTVDYTVEAIPNEHEWGPRYSFSFSKLPDKYIDVDAITEAGLLGYTSKDGHTVASDLAQKGLLPEDSPYWLLKNSDKAEEPIAFFAARREQYVPCSVPLTIANSGGTKLMHLLAANNKLPPDFDDWFNLDERNNSVLNISITNGHLPHNLPDDVWDKPICPSSSRTVAEQAAVHGFIPGKYDVSAKAGVGGTLGGVLAKWLILRNKQTFRDVLMKSLKPEDWALSDDKSISIAGRAYVNNVQIPDNVPLNTPTRYRFDGSASSTLAHDMAVNLDLPEGFDGWDIEVEGNTVALLFFGRAGNNGHGFARAEMSCLDRCAPMTEDVLSHPVQGPISCRPDCLPQSEEDLQYERPQSSFCVADIAIEAGFEEYVQRCRRIAADGLTMA
jgi:hypothetical protein